MKVQTYLKALLGTFTTTVYYRDVVKAPVSFSLKFFVASLLLLSLIRIGLFWQRELPQFHQQLEFASTELEKHFPSDLTITWDGQKLESSSSGPIPIYYPSNWDHANLPKMLGYLDTHSQSLSELQQKTKTSALFFVTDKNLYLAQATSGYSTLPLAEFSPLVSPLTITQTELKNHRAEWLKNIWQAGLPLFIVGSVLYPLYLWATVLLSITIMSWMGWYVTKTFGQAFAFKRIWQVGLHLAVVAQSIALIQVWFWPTLHLPLFSITFWLYFTLVMIDLVRNSALKSSR